MFLAQYAQKLLSANTTVLIFGKLKVSSKKPPPRRYVRMEEIERGAEENLPGFKVVRKLLSDRRFDK